MTQNNSSLHIDLCYQTDEDRMLLSLRLAGSRVDWWLTRRMTLTLVQAWIGRVQSVGLPIVPLAHLGGESRDVAAEHLLSLEFDGPRDAGQPQAHLEPTLIQTASISVSQLDSTLTLIAGGKSSQIKLTRRESHAFLEMITSNAIGAGWMKAPDLPDWLGANGNG